MSDLKNTKTEKNLQTALQGEALAHLKYQFYRSMISSYSKNYEQMLDEIIHNEKEHGKIWFKALNGNTIPSTAENLLDAYIGEKKEHMEMYPHFSRVAKEEGFDEISELFDRIGKIEGEHMELFGNIMKERDNDTPFTSLKEDTTWKCLNCGYKYEGINALDECPVCKHPRKYFTKQ